MDSPLLSQVPLRPSGNHSVFLQLRFSTNIEGKFIYLDPWVQTLFNLITKKCSHSPYTRVKRRMLIKFSCNYLKLMSAHYQARARARRACALRALGLLLADGTPTVGGGKTF